MSGRASQRAGSWRGFARTLYLASIIMASIPLPCIGQNVVDGFDAGVQGPGSPGVTALAVQPDGKIIVGGSFATVNATSRGNIARLNIDGTLDTTFVASNVHPVNAVAVQADGKILVGTSAYDLVRLNSDGSPDATFASPSLDQPVHAIAVQGDGKILIGGAFTSVAGTSRHIVARLNSNGSLDNTFAVPTPNTNASVSAMILQPDGKIIIGGYFSTFAFQSSHGVARLNTDGTLDYAFVDPNVTAAGNAVVYALALQTDGQIVIGGDFSSVGGQTHANVARLGANGSVDMTFYDVGLDNYVTSLLLRPDGTILVGGYFGDFVNLLASDGHFAAQYFPTANDAVTSLIQQADGKILIGGYFTYIGGGAPANGIARLYATGAIDSDLTDGAVGGQVSALAVQTDGKIIVGGGFTAIRTSPTTTIGHAGIARFNADGSLDAYDPLLTAANPPAINALALQPDGKTIIAGYFTGIDSQARNKIARVNVDGGLDGAFDANQNPNDFVSALAVQPDGKIVVGGPFTYISGQTRNHIARLNADGTLDAPFNPDADSGIGAIALQADGKLVVAGSFSTIGGQTRNRIARLDTAGNLDATFVDPGANGSVSSLIVQPDGKILVSGFFLMIGGQTQCCIARLNADGTLDETFTANPDNYVEAMLLQTDGKIVIGGQFNYVSGQKHLYLARLNSNGSLDDTFTADASNSVLALAAQFDGKLVVGGLFATLGGKSRGGVARLSEPALVQQSFAVVGYTSGGGSVTFTRSGDGPEFGEPPQLYFSTDGQSFSPVGPMQRIDGGWRYSGLALPPLNEHFYLRATGQFSSGQLDGSGGIITNTAQIYLGSNDGIFADNFE